MRERLDGGLLGIAGPVTRSRDPGSIRQQPFDVDIMDSEVIPSPGAVGGEMEALGDNGRVLVSDPLQRNLEAARKSFYIVHNSFLNRQYLLLFNFIDYLSDDQPARICQRIRGNASSTTPGSPMSASSSTVMLQNISNRSPTRRAAASSSCPSPLSLDKDTTETPAILNLDKSDSLDGTLFFWYLQVA